MKTQVLAVQADRTPMPNVEITGPHQLYRNPRVVLQERELGPLHPDEMRVQVMYAGVCGTDVHLTSADPTTGYVQCSAPAKIPPEGRVLGHEGVGRVLEIGNHVRHVKPGAYVTFESIIVCHYCDVCRSGHFNQCRRARLLGLEKDGLFGTIVDVPSMLSHDVSVLGDSEEGLKAAACIEPAGVAYVACQNTRVSAGEVVVVFGAGPIGAFAAMLSKGVFGAAEVHVVESIPFRRELVRQWCDHVFDIDEFFEHPPRNVDVIIEASGDLSNVTRCFRRLNANGRVVLLGRSGSALHLDAVDHMITNQIEIVGSRGHLCGAFEKLLTLYRMGRLDLGGVVTSTVFGLDKLHNTLSMPGVVLNENCKILVQPTR
jgi:threonine dehydrogenase-like Zn-dependent dehydrogenase